VNSPVKCDVSNKMCVSSALFPVSPSGSRLTMAKIEFSGEDKALNASAKVDEIQHLFFGPRNMQHCVATSQHVHSGRNLVQEDGSDSVERRGHQKPSAANQCISHGDIKSSSSTKKFIEQRDVCVCFQWTKKSSHSSS